MSDRQLADHYARMLLAIVFLLLVLAAMLDKTLVGLSGP